MLLRHACLTSALALATALPASAEMVFNRIAILPTTANMAAGEDLARESSAEIISASEDGMTLVYTDSPLGVIGLVDITDPARRKLWATSKWVASRRPRSSIGDDLRRGEHVGKLHWPALGQAGDGRSRNPGGHGGM
jgi:hypothetical protein